MLILLSSLCPSHVLTKGQSDQVSNVDYRRMSDLWIKLYCSYSDGFLGIMIS